ncbi:MAG: hypothetical protein Q4F67_08765 [Propionibacteriaceae bacterium]|nr:hypothetical protein [Propionibacteriaceae bacterium]
MRKWIVVSAAVAATMGLAGCGGTTVSGTVPTPSATAPRTPTPRPTTPTPTPPEQRVFVDGPPAIQIQTQEGTATVAVRRYSWQRTAISGEFAPPKHRYLVLDIAVTATGGKVQANPLYFTVRTGSGDEVGSVLGADGNEPLFTSKELTPPGVAEGMVTFDTPAEPVVLIVADELGNQAGQIPLGAPDTAAD